jgi:uncharacterized membrane protein
MGVTRRLKTYFLRGLAVLLPTILTIWIFGWAYTFIQENVTVYINRGLVWVVVRAQGEGGIPESRLTEILVEGTAGSIIGFFVGLVVVCLVGALLASVVGKAVWLMVESFIMNVPVLKRIYPYVKQVTDFVFTPQEQQKLFSRVVAVEYPRKGMWSIGFVTGSRRIKVAENVEKEFLIIMIPTAPTPVTGYVIMVVKEQTVALDMTVEEAFRFIVSAGVVAPESRRWSPLQESFAGSIG